MRKNKEPKLTQEQIIQRDKENNEKMKREYMAHLRKTDIDKWQEIVDYEAAERSHALKVEKKEKLAPYLTRIDRGDITPWYTLQEKPGCESFIYNEDNIGPKILELDEWVTPKQREAIYNAAIKYSEELFRTKVKNVLEYSSSVSAADAQYYDTIVAAQLLYIEALAIAQHDETKVELRKKMRHFLYSVDENCLGPQSAVFTFRGALSFSMESVFLTCEPPEMTQSNLKYNAIARYYADAALKLGFGRATGDPTEPFEKDFFRNVTSDKKLLEIADGIFNKKITKTIPKRPLSRLEIGNKRFGGIYTKVYEKTIEEKETTPLEEIPVIVHTNGRDPRLIAIQKEYNPQFPRIYTLLTFGPDILLYDDTADELKRYTFENRFTPEGYINSEMSYSGDDYSPLIFPSYDPITKSISLLQLSVKFSPETTQKIAYEVARKGEEIRKKYMLGMFEKNNVSPDAWGVTDPGKISVTLELSIYNDNAEQNRILFSKTFESDIIAKQNLELSEAKGHKNFLKYARKERNKFLGSVWKNEFKFLSPINKTENPLYGSRTADSYEIKMCLDNADEINNEIAQIISEYFTHGYLEYLGPEINETVSYKEQAIRSSDAYLPDRQVNELLQKKFEAEDSVMNAYRSRSKLQKIATDMSKDISGAELQSIYERIISDEQKAKDKLSEWSKLEAQIENGADIKLAKQAKELKDNDEEMFTNFLGQDTYEEH